MIEFLANHKPESIAIIAGADGEETTYQQLSERVASAADILRRELNRGLVLLISDNAADSIVLYLACLEAKYPVCLLEPGLAERLEPLLQAYDPVALLLPETLEDITGNQGNTSIRLGSFMMSKLRRRKSQHSIHADLALLLLTSGSTGSPKTVRLTSQNLLTNARSIASYLGIEPGERSIQSLPVHYSYGLSLVNSHLVSGATVVLTEHSFMRPEFWKDFDGTQCTSFAGVPYIYETLDRLRFDPARHPSLKTMTQAGGGLRNDLIETFHERCTAAGCRLFVMYGQTEATARISYVPHERLEDKIGSIGIPIPGGRLSLQKLDDSDEQELVYQGPNVMMGYAESATDLTSGDEFQGRLHTGDLARVDADGFYYLTGRLTRFAKLFGRRISLEDVETVFESQYALQAAAIEAAGGLRIFVVTEADVDEQEIGKELALRLSVPPQCVTVSLVTELPRTASGKKDYKALSTL